ncbi:DUF4376 domain-containing protein [Ochrobactrum intermedium]|uniref:DUF4376 domain-containing protein n=1 Tax=Brucella intermedia TaxID=94625 RepID=UPI00159C277E|nr:DUF4376 domain-containing protein [Brucella intermedia]NVM41956.1 DUF4376 domain-containing protein [Brucella intermedia]
MSSTTQIIDIHKVGTKGFPRHYKALGLEPPTKTVPVENGEPQTNHPGMTLQEYAAAKRWEREVSGTIWNGWPVLSDRESQSKIIAEAVAIEKGERADGDPWKFADGEFRPLTNEQMDDLAAAVRLHVRNSYGIEARVLAAIEAGSITTEAQIDAAFA